MFPSNKLLIRTAFGSLLAILLIGCQPKGASPSSAKGSATPVPVTVRVGLPIKKSIRSSFEQPGTIQAYEATPLVARIPGYVKAVQVEIDDTIQGPREGQLGSVLLEMDVPELVQEHRQKQALTAQAQAEEELARKNLQAFEASVQSAKAAVKEAEARERGAKANYERWKSEASRVDDLVVRKVVDTQTGEETRNQLVTAEGSFEEAKAHTESSRAHEKEAEAKRDKASAEVVAMKARVQACEAESRRIATLIEFATIRAPYDGIVTGRFVHTGHYLQPGMGKAEPILTVARIDKVRISIDIPEGIAGRLHKGMKVRVRVPGLRNMEYDAQIARTSWALTPDVHVLKAEVDLPNPERRIRPGMYAHVVIPMESSDAYTLPLSAVSHQDDQSFCFLMQEGKSVKYLIQIGQTDGDRVEVLRKRKVNVREWQLWEGNEQVIEQHQGALSDGGPVEMQPK